MQAPRRRRAVEPRAGPGMSVFDAPAGRGAPRGMAKLLAINWSLVVLLTAVACAGFLMLYSVADGSLEPWAEAQMVRFAVGIAVMIAIGMIDIRFWRMMAPLAYAVSLLLLVAVDVMGVIGMGAQRWIDLGPVQIQPSEMMKIALVMALAAYYARLDAAEGLAALLGDPAAPPHPDAGRARHGAARPRHRDPAPRRRRRGDVPRRRQPLVLRRRGRLGRRPRHPSSSSRRAPRGSCSRTTSSAASSPSSTPPPTRSAPATTSPRR